MGLNKWIHLAVMAFCSWRAGRYIKKAERAHGKMDLCIQEARSWLDCMNQHRRELEEGDAT